MEEVNEIVKTYMFFVFDELIRQGQLDPETFDKENENYNEEWFYDFSNTISNNYEEGYSIVNYCKENDIDYNTLMCNNCNNLKMLEEVVYCMNIFETNVYDNHKITNNEIVLHLYAYAYLNSNYFEDELVEYYNNKPEYVLK
jgi:hypothetical protein